jgi:rod shape determining protein RodA
LVNYAPATVAARPRIRSLSARFDVVLVGCTVLLGVIGVVTVYTATKGKLALAGEDPRYFLKRQAIFLIIGGAVMVAMALFDYRRLEQVSTVLYIGILVALVAVLATPARLGAQRWFPLGPIQLQPSEFATLVLIIAIATYCSRRPEGLEFRDLVRMVLMAGLPILLVFKQPDLGTAIVMSVILLVMLAVAGMPGRYLLALIAAAVLLVLFAVNVGLLQKYQIDRLTSFISPNGASQAATYNVAQAKEAIAHGGMFGRGLGHGACPSSRQFSSSRPWGSWWASSGPACSWPSTGSWPGVSCAPPSWPGTIWAGCCARASLPSWCSRCLRTSV